MTTLKFKYTVSRGRDTYGYNIVTLYVNDNRVSSCNGGGYDMQGTVLAEFLQARYSHRIKRLTSGTGKFQHQGGFYGLSFWKRNKSGKHRALKRYSEGASMSLDGGCGFSCMERIAKKIGITLKYIDQSKNQTIYTLTDKKEV